METTKGFWFGRNPAKGEWVPFEWDDPVHGHQVVGEVAVVRSSGTMGSHTSGFWRVGETTPGSASDGSCQVKSSSPDGDEVLLVMEGEATVTVASSGKQHRVTRGSIVFHPKNVDVIWDIKGPFFKKFWVRWDCDNPAATMDDITVGHIDAEPAAWAPWKFVEPAEGPQEGGELYNILQKGGSTGTLLAGVWRATPGRYGCDPDGACSVPYTSVLGDETELLIEGQVHVRDDQTGEEWDCQAGDLLGITAGVHITWSGQGPFVKKLWVITNDKLPEDVPVVVAGGPTTNLTDLLGLER